MSPHEQHVRSQHLTLLSSEYLGFMPVVFPVACARMPTVLLIAKLEESNQLLVRSINQLSQPLNKEHRLIILINHTNNCRGLETAETRQGLSRLLAPVYNTKLYSSRRLALIIFVSKNLDLE
uniref:Centromere protein M n=1 Tax=Parascaris univalens TaxID=6257 RepID=A0A914ZY27_PARUN